MPQIDFIGIDNYMPMSDWRDGEDHADAGWGRSTISITCAANVAGGEGYDWYLPFGRGRRRRSARRSPMALTASPGSVATRTSEAGGREPASRPDRRGAAGVATAWVPESKPIWFTELGCAAVDKGTNQPNKFLDPKSSEIAPAPQFSNGLRDDLIQRQYLRAMHAYWNDPGKQPGLGRSTAGRWWTWRARYVWAWDARPYPWFPNTDDLWSDGPNYRRGHWINGRVSARTLASVVGEICDRSGLRAYDTRRLFGFVRGYMVPNVADARRALQPLMLTYGFDAIERGGTLEFRMRTGRSPVALSRDDLAVTDEIEGDLQETRGPTVEMAGRIRLRFVEAEGDHQIVAEETVLPDDETHAVAETDLELALTRAEGRQTLERWLSEARLARDTLRFSLPPSRLGLGAGDIVSLPSPSGPTLARIDRVEVTTQQLIDAVRIDPALYEPSQFPDDAVSLRPFTSAGPVLPLFLDLPLMTGKRCPCATYRGLCQTLAG